MNATDRHLGVTMKGLKPILHVVSDTAAAVILGGLLAVPGVLWTVSFTMRDVPLEHQPLAVSEHAVVEEEQPGAVERFVDELRRRRPRDSVEVHPTEDGTVRIVRLSRGEAFVLMPAVGSAPDLELRSGGCGRNVIRWLEPYLPEGAGELGPAESVQALARAAFAYLKHAGEAPQDRVMVRTVRLAVPVFFSTTALALLVLGTVRLWRGAVAARLAWRPTGRLLALGVAGGAVCLALSFTLELLLRLVGVSIPEQPLVAMVLDHSPTAALAVPALVVLAPLAEELFFRGYVFRHLLQESTRATAYGSATLLFAVAHLHPIAIPVYALFGLVLARLTERSRSIVPAVAAHALINAVVVVIHTVG